MDYVEIINMPHVLFGIMGTFLALWTFVEILNARPENEKRLKITSWLMLISMSLSYLIGGWWYVKFYGVAEIGDRSTILEGPWPWAHSFFMEAKEHLFLMLFMLSIFLPIVIFGNDLKTNKTARNLALLTAGLIVLLGMGMEGFGAVITKGVKMGLLGGN